MLDRNMTADSSLAKDAIAPMRLLYSQTYYGLPQKCTGVDQLLLARGPWEDAAILIRGIALTHRVYPPTADAFAMAGSSAIDGDILGHVSGSGTAQIMYPESTGFLFPGRPSDRHIDVHAWCGKGTMHEAWLTIFYQKPAPEWLQPLPIGHADNDLLAEIARSRPIYQPIPPDPPLTLRDHIANRMPAPLRRRVSKLIRLVERDRRTET